MKLFKILFFIAVLGLVGITTGCRGCGCNKQTTRPAVEKNEPEKKEKDVVRPEEEQQKETPASNTEPDKGKSDPRGAGDNPGKF